MKKHMFRLSVLLLTAFAGIGCTEEIKFGDNFLDKAPGVDIDIDEVFSKAENARYFLWNVYSDMYVGLNEKNSGVTYRLDGGNMDALSDSHHSAIGYDSPGTTYYPGTIPFKPKTGVPSVASSPSRNPACGSAYATPGSSSKTSIVSPTCRRRRRSG